MGGGVMRTAAKVASIGTVMHGGLRGSPGVQSVCTASVPVTSAVGVLAQSVKVSQEDKLWAAAAAVDEWEVIGGDEGELVMSAGEPMPRVVFGAAPSYNEAREATEELKHALDKAYLSSAKITELDEPTAAEKVSGLSLFSDAGSEAESALLSRTVVPQHAYQAFELLSQSSEAQNVVASIASDPNIWNAMMENPVVKQFMASQKSVNQFPYESASESEDFNPSSAKDVNEKSDSGECIDLEQVFNDFMGKVKVTVNTIASNLSTFIQNIFEPPTDDNATSRNVIASGFMGLALMVVMVVLMKRA